MRYKSYGNTINLRSKPKPSQKKASLTQQQVTNQAKKHVNYYARIERGEENPSYETIEKKLEPLRSNLQKFFSFQSFRVTFPSSETVIFPDFKPSSTRSIKWLAIFLMPSIVFIAFSRLASS